MLVSPGGFRPPGRPRRPRARPQRRQRWLLNAAQLAGLRAAKPRSCRRSSRTHPPLGGPHNRRSPRRAEPDQPGHHAALGPTTLATAALTGRVARPPGDFPRNARNARKCDRCPPSPATSRDREHRTLRSPRGGMPAPTTAEARRTRLGRGRSALAVGHPTLRAGARRGLLDTPGTEVTDIEQRARAAEHMER